jgi:1-deoxy-D-xylulose-5-phosphate synthase
MVVMAASDENECRRMLTTAYRYPGPAAVRYPRGAGTGATVEKALTDIPLGTGEIRRQGKGGVAILAFGTMVAPAIAAGERLDATVANMRFIKPLDIELVRRLADSHDALVTVEEGALMGGAGSAVAEALAAAGIVKPLLQLGLPDRFIDHGDAAQLLAMCGLDADGIAASIARRFGGDGGSALGGGEDKGVAAGADLATVASDTDGTGETTDAGETGRPGGEPRLVVNN